jgi:hypothetical protein
MSTENIPTSVVKISGSCGRPECRNCGGHAEWVPVNPACTCFGEINDVHCKAYELFVHMLRTRYRMNNNEVHAVLQTEHPDDEYVVQLVEEYNREIALSA